MPAAGRQRDTAWRFADLALAAHERLGDRVSSWITLNEPWCSAFLGYASGAHAPGRREPAAALRATHHLLLGHGLATAALRDAGASADIGITLNLYPVHAASEDPADIDAARRLDGMQNRIFLDPVLRGGYPIDVLEDLIARGFDLDHIQTGDLDIIGAPIDVLGVNYYSSFCVRVANGHPPHQHRLGVPWVGCDDIDFVSRHLPLTHMDWEVDPDGLRQMLVRLQRDYDCPPIVITENGAAYRDLPATTGEVDDPDRIAVRGVPSACRAGRPSVRACRCAATSCGRCSTTSSGRGDTADGSALVHVDFATQLRTPQVQRLSLSRDRGRQRARPYRLA